MSVRSLFTATKPTRRPVSEHPNLPAEIDAEIRRASAARVARVAGLAAQAEADCARAIQRCQATTALIEGALRRGEVEAGISAWRPSYSLVRGGK